MRVVSTKLFPTPTNYQQNGDYTTPLMIPKLIEFLQKQMAKVPEGAQRDSMRVRHWGAMEIWFDEEKTPLEDAHDALRTIKQAFLAAGDRPLPAAQVEALIKLIPV